VLYGLALIAFGLSHFAYRELTAPLVPAWLPGHIFWAYLTGAIYLATGVALVIGIFAHLAAVLAAVQIALITLLVWGPGVLHGHIGADTWQETVVSWTLTVAAWVLATSFGPGSLLRLFAIGALGRKHFGRR
jgi:intracellular septation protein A